MVKTMQKATWQRMSHLSNKLDSLKEDGPIRTGWKNQELIMKIEAKLQANIDVGQRHLLLGLMRRKLFSKCKRIIVKILMQFPLHKRKSQTWFLRKKSGIVKGLGMRPSSSLVTTASSSSSAEYIHQLENEIIELKEARVRDEEERAKEQEARAKEQEARVKQDEIQKNILNFLRSKGYDEGFNYGGGSSSS
ncbi:uncharacterized protein LOC136064532 isoform X2 [Quercus suber]|uniref:uncharacterized protein LOC136064532 isoform X2 n=1 Tax=Quercus suber TaxID=58331 RepID=UPI0032DF62B0